MTSPTGSSDPREALQAWLDDPLRDYLDDRDRGYLAALAAPMTSPTGSSTPITFERWVESLHEDANGIVWITKGEILAAAAFAAQASSEAPTLRCRNCGRDDRGCECVGGGDFDYVRASSEAEGLDVERLAKAMLLARRSKFVYETAQEVAAEYAHLGESRHDK